MMLDQVGDSFEAQLIVGNATLGTQLADVADFQEDADVDRFDLDAWEDNYGECCASHGEGDAGWDGDVDGLDFLIWRRQYTGVINPLVASVTAVPEPSAGLLLTLAAMAVVFRRSKAHGLQPVGFWPLMGIDETAAGGLT